MSRILFPIVALTFVAVIGCGKSDSPRARTTRREHPIDKAERALEYEAQQAREQIDLMVRDAHDELKEALDASRERLRETTDPLNWWQAEREARMAEDEKDRAILTDEEDEVIEADYEKKLRSRGYRERDEELRDDIESLFDRESSREASGAPAGASKPRTSSGLVENLASGGTGVSPVVKKDRTGKLPVPPKLEA